MNRQKILDRLRENEGALRARGVMHAALFGSQRMKHPWSSEMTSGE